MKRFIRGMPALEFWIWIVTMALLVSAIGGLPSVRNDRAAIEPVEAAAWALGWVVGAMIFRVPYSSTVTILSAILLWSFFR
ncbi:MAG: hypothetical protein MZW92_71820 [Comamonadaceae bacterium]|nr:hypothetical protein [Comamonadaceae bacterium]